MMATRPTGLSGIAYCHFATYCTDSKRKCNWARLIVYGIVPIIVGILLALHLGKPADDAMSMVVAVFAVVAAVLIGLLPLVHSILGQANTERKYDQGERPLAQQELDRVQTLQDLHAAISWAVILLVLALGCCAAIAMIPAKEDQQGFAWQDVVHWVLLAILYSVMASTALTFFDVARGVFEGMESHSEAVKTKIRNNVKPIADDEQEG
jgi:uncharacterized membrane protein HdeD (DUF308 family)